MDLYKVKKCTAIMADSTTEQRNSLLLKIASALQSNADYLFEENRKDLANAANLSPAVYSRLKFDRSKLDSVVESVVQVASLPDPVGKVLMREELDDNLFLEKINVPIGVIGMIFEARPDALVQIASLCLKSGNCLVLKGGSEAMNTNRALYKVITDVSKDSFLTSSWIELLETRDDVAKMLAAEGLIDLIIPRGSYSFVRYVMQNTSIPVLGHAEGLCSMYIDKEASLTKAVDCALDAKTNAPGT
ncbi:MAG: aldehyde dehydrogenase family protein, partial [Spirochaetales bacterium]